MNAICPLADTPGFGEFDDAAPGAVEAQVLRWCRSGASATPSSTSGAVVYLASADGRYITGTTLMVRRRRQPPALTSRAHR